MATTKQTRSARLLKVLADYQQVLVIMHDNPDPDAIASGWALTWLIRQKLGKPARLIGGGDIIRAENKHMVRLLRPPMELVREIACPQGAAVLLVDCGPGSENHLFASQCAPPVAVVDHHLLNGRSPRKGIPFCDIRPRVAASATISTCYLREQKVEPGKNLATALMYAIRTETRGNQNFYSRTDRSALLWLTERADLTQLAEIEDAPLSVEYFSDLALALQNTVLYQDVAFCLLPRAHGAEIVGEVADLLIRCEPVRRVLCGAVVKGDVVISVRTSDDAEDATRLVAATLDGLGQGGGHPHRAGGKISAATAGARMMENLQSELRNRWLAACHRAEQGGTYLIARRDIVENL